MGIQHKDGYSAAVESYLIIDGARYKLAKTNGETLMLHEDCVTPPGTVATMSITVDGDTRSKQVRLPDGIGAGDRIARYMVEAPF